MASTRTRSKRRRGLGARMTKPVSVPRFTIRAPEKSQRPAYRSELKYESQFGICAQDKLKDYGSLKTCPVEQAFKDGKPILRFCVGHKQPGYIYVIEDAAEALKVAQRICSCFGKKRNLQACVPKGMQFGGLKRRKRKVRT